MKVFSKRFRKECKDIGWLWVAIIGYFIGFSMMALPLLVWLLRR